MFVASEAQIVNCLAHGCNLTWISETTGWPVRQVHNVAGRHGYLFTADGTPYKPPSVDRKWRGNRADARTANPGPQRPARMVASLDSSSPMARTLSSPVPLSTGKQDTLWRL